MRNRNIRHTRNCRLSTNRFARLKCMLVLDFKKLKDKCKTRWLNCSNCCHEFVEFSLHNFSAFLCARHELDAQEFVRIERSYRQIISKLNRRSRHRYLQHIKLNKMNKGRCEIVQCPPESFPLSDIELTRLHHTLRKSYACPSTSQASSNFVQRKMTTAHTFGPPSCTCSFCGAVLWYEERVKKGSTIANPKFSICCKKGMVQLPPYKQAPDYLTNLLDYSGGAVAQHFRHNIRAYNSAFAFTSMGGHVDNSINNGRGPYVFRINGQNHHRIGSLLPPSGKPKFAQLYFYDTNNEVRNRVAVHAGSSTSHLDEVVVQNLISMFNHCNQLVKVFRMARDRFHSNEYKPVCIKLLEKRYTDGRQYNMPTCSEIAALTDTSNVDSCGCRDIVIEDVNGILKRISEKHPSFMSMQYPLLFPYGEDGFRCNIEYRPIDGCVSIKRTSVTMREYYAYRIQHRQLNGGVLLLGGRIFQQFVVDCYTCIEEDRLCWVKNNQNTLRCEVYRGLQDAITAGDMNAHSIGKKVILPSSFTGGPRYMVQNYQDAMAICRWAGSPDYFITFTCNPKWPEIELALSLIPGQHSVDRPDIVTRVFQMKLKELIHDIKSNSHFGKVKALLYTIEFQKRGLPHAHLLVFVFGDQRPNALTNIDSIVSAEIPDKNVDLFAYQSVCQYMIHGPCSYANPDCPCMVDGSCSKHYPKQYTNETTFDKVGFPIYRRRKNGCTAKSMDDFVQDNSWVVPHNLDWLLNTKLI